MSKPGFICKDGASNFYMRHEGMGSFLCPPGAAEHEWSIVEERGGNMVGSYSLKGAIEESWLPILVRLHAKFKINKSKRNLVPDPFWVAEVYNYFRHCYAPENLDRNVSHCIVDNSMSIPPERSLAVLHIKEWFADYPIRYEFLDGAPFGSWSNGYYGK